MAIDLAEALRAQGLTGAVDEDALEVLALPAAGRGEPAAERAAPASARVPHRLDRLYGSTRATLHFVVPDAAHVEFEARFEVGPAGAPPGRPPRYPGLVGDGDFFRERFGRRELAPSHFDCFADLDGDGDLDLFQGGVEPHVHCHENAGGNRLVYRGRLASGGELLRLPASRANRSWVTVAFFDLDGDGDQDFLPSFNDGPDSGRVVLYRNVTRERGGRLEFERAGPLETRSGVPLAGGAQAGGWFPSIAFARDWDGTGAVAALVGSRNRCWLYRGQGPAAGGIPRFADAVALEAGGVEIDLVNPRFDLADADGDGDLDLFAGTQPGPVYLFWNQGSRTAARLAAGTAVAFTGRYLIGDAHSGVKVADFDGDGLLDLAAGRFWERADLDQPEAPRAFGGFWRNAGSRQVPRFEKREGLGPHGEGFPICDAVRQNSVRAADWDRDGRLDLLAGDTDGFVWLFVAEGDRGFPLFAPGRRFRAGNRPLDVTSDGGHARLDACDWDGDGRLDLLVASGGGTVTFFRNEGTGPEAVLAAGRWLEAGGKPIQVGGRSSLLACDWDADGGKDLVLADDRGYWFLRNERAAGGGAAGASGEEPALAAPKAILFGGRPVTYVRPNLGSFADWDGDGKRDLIGCHFENSIRLYRNIGSGARGVEPEFADPEGVVILEASSPQMISGAEVVDWNGDGDLDILTGQGHGGSGLRFYERNWLEDERRGTHPVVKVVGIETPANQEPR